jgi:hypothetical protein
LESYLVSKMQKRLFAFERIAEFTAGNIVNHRS